MNPVLKRLLQTDQVQSEILRDTPDRSEFDYLANDVRRANLLREDMTLVEDIGETCVVLAECLIWALASSHLPWDSNALGADTGPVLAMALAMGWNPVDRCCNAEQLTAFARAHGVPIGADADVEVVNRFQYTLRDILSGCDVPSVDSPFVDAYCLLNEKAKREAASLSKESDTELGDDEDGGSALGYEDIDEIMVVGRGIGHTRKVLQECCFTAGICLRGGGLVTDGLVHIRSDVQAQVLGLMGEHCQTPGFLQMATSTQRPMNHLYRELQGLAKSSAYVRIHKIDREDRTALITERVQELIATPVQEGCVMAPVDEGETAASIPVPVRSSSSDPHGVSCGFRIPKAIVESEFFVRAVGTFEECMLGRLVADAKTREDFHKEEVSDDRRQLTEITVMLRRILDELPDEQTIEACQGVRENAKDEGLRSTQDESLISSVKRAMSNLLTRDRVHRIDLAAFGLVLAEASALTRGVIGWDKASDDLKRTAERLEARLKELKFLNTSVDHKRGTKTVLANPRESNGLEYYGEILPQSIQMHLKWCDEMRMLREQIESVRVSEGLRQWTAAMVLDHTLRNLDLDVDGPIADSFKEFRKAARPFLLMAYKSALHRHGVEAIDTLATQNMVFACSYVGEGIGEEIRIVPQYFVNSKYSALSFAPKQLVARVDDVMMSVESAESRIPRDASDVVDDFKRVIADHDYERPADLLEDLQVAPIDTLGALFESPRPGEAEPRAATADVDVEGLVALLRSDHLVQMHALPAALDELARVVRLGVKDTGGEPFTRANPQNLLPEIPWRCLQLIAVATMRQDPERYAHLGGSFFDLIASWIQIIAGRHQAYIRDTGLSEPTKTLISQCVDVIEKWDRDFLQQVLKDPQLHSRRYGHVMTALSGGRVPDSEFHFDEKEQDRITKGIQRGFKRARARDARRLLPTLVRLQETADRSAREGPERLDLFDTLGPDLAQVGTSLGQSQTLQIHRLLDGLLGFEHKELEGRDRG